MPTPLTGLRIATSYLTPSGVASDSAEIDFQLGAQEGIEIFSVVGTVTILAEALAAASTETQAEQTLHLRTGTLETVPNASGEDAQLIDSSIFYRQDITVLGQETSGIGSAAIAITPQGLVPYPEPIFSSQNITHLAEGHEASWVFGMGIHIFYRFVKFSLSELGLILARRQ